MQMDLTTFSTSMQQLEDSIKAHLDTKLIPVEATTANIQREVDGMRGSIGMMQRNMLTMIDDITKLKDKVASLEEKLAGVLAQSNGPFENVVVSGDFKQPATGKKFTYDDLKKVVKHVKEASALDLRSYNVDDAIESVKIIASDLLTRKAHEEGTDPTTPYMHLPYHLELQRTLTTKCKAFFPLGACERNWGSRQVLIKVWSQRVTEANKQARKAGIYWWCSCKVNV